MADPGSGSWFKGDEEDYNSTTKKWGTVSPRYDISFGLYPPLELENAC
jgi:hypothetical protein